MTRPRRTVGRPLPVHRMTDHDEMTGASAWDDWQRRQDLGREIAAQLPEVLSTAWCVVGVDPGDDEAPALVAQIACARCGARGIPTGYAYCPRCGRGGGWAQLERVPGLTLHALRGRW